MIQYKECNCDEDYWEEIVVNKDKNYDFVTTLYFHCSCCSEDFRVENFETGQLLKFKEDISTTEEKKHTSTD